MKAYTEQKHTYEFWSKVAITDDDKCWLWNGACNWKGYGVTWWQKKFNRAHRVSWLITNGNIPNGLFVLHTCDVRNCVNPKHLFLGTHQDNMKDMTAKGRHAKSRKAIKVQS